MKKITLILAALLCLSSTSVLAKVLYCVGDAAVGFEPGNNYSIGRFNPIRFQVDVDFERKTMEAKTHLIEPFEWTCWAGGFGTLFCRNVLGSTILGIDPDTLKYHLASTFLKKGNSDSIWVEHGSCEAF